MALTLLWAAPGLAALAVLFLSPRAARRAALAVALAVLAYALWLAVPYSAEAGLLRLEHAGAGSYGIRYRVGVDGLALSLCWLTALLVPLSLWVEREGKPAGYWAAFLALESALLGVFTMQNLFYFYVFWDAALIPMFFIIGLWGSEGRRHAAVKFLLYTFFGSLLLLLGIAALAALSQRATGAWTFDIPELARAPVGRSAAVWIFAAMAVGFAVKIPVWPLHNWLPDAHTEAPAAGSVLLAGAMLKMGLYGFLRILLPVFPELAREAMPWLCGLGALNIVYGALCAMAQTDLKRLIAYTSISHLGFCMLGVFSLTPEGLSGGSLQMLNHGLSTGALFLLVGMMYERAHRRGVSDFGGLARTAPWLSFFFAFALLSSIGLPGLNGFVGEFLSLAGASRVARPAAAAGIVGVALAAAYALPAFQKVFWEPAGAGSASPAVGDLVAREKAVLGLLAVLILAIGLYPRPLLGLLEPTALSLAVRP